MRLLLLFVFVLLLCINFLSKGLFERLFVSNNTMNFNSSTSNSISSFFGNINHNNTNNLSNNPLLRKLMQSSNSNTNNNSNINNTQNLFQQLYNNFILNVKNANSPSNEAVLLNNLISQLQTQNTNPLNYSQYLNMDLTPKYNSNPMTPNNYVQYNNQNSGFIGYIQNLNLNNSISFADQVNTPMSHVSNMYQYPVNVKGQLTPNGNIFNDGGSPFPIFNQPQKAYNNCCSFTEMVGMTKRGPI